MESTNQTEQPVKPAITASDAIEYVAAQNAIVQEVLADEKNYALAPELFIKHRHFMITAHLKPDYQQVIGLGKTTMDAVAAFRADLDYKRKEAPRRLREEAARKLMEAEELEVEMGGVK